MVETPLDTPRIWVELTDPDDPDERFRCDLTWLTSSYTCIFGRGCPGIDADSPDLGCCALGAHFCSPEDLDRVAAVVERLGPDEWQYHDEGHGPGGWYETEGEEVRTRVVDGGCVLANRPGFPAGAGCALHRHALAEGVEPLTTKPDVCWQLPLRRTYRTVDPGDGTTYLETTIGEYDRRGWGPGGHDLDWYCTGSPQAHVGAEPLFRSCAAELTELMGAAAYAQLVQHCEAHLELVAAASASPGGRELLPLLVHPATLVARRVGAQDGTVT